MIDLHKAARRVGDAANHDTIEHAWSKPDLNLCPGCRAERAALAELERAVVFAGDPAAALQVTTERDALKAQLATVQHVAFDLQIRCDRYRAALERIAVGTIDAHGDSEFIAGIEAIARAALHPEEPK